MEVQLDAPGGLRRQMTVRIPADTVTKAVDDRLKRLSSRARIPGFRPGKAPMKVIRQQYGESARMEAVSELVQQSYPEALTQAGVNPAGMPKIDVTAEKPGEPLEYVAAFEVYPEIQLADLSQLKVERPVVEITEADVDRLIDNLRKARRSFAVAERPAATGDQVTIDFVGKLDGSPFDGGSAQGMTVELGAGRFLPDLEQGIVGHSAGETFTVDVAFPEDYRAEQLKGKTAQFEVTLHEVRAPQLPAIDDPGFLQAHGVETVDTLRDKSRAALENERDKAIRNRVKAQVMEQLLVLNPVEVPDTLVQQEIPRLRVEAAGRMNMQQMPEDKLAEMLPASLFEANARRRVALGLIVGEVVKQREVKLQKDRLDAALEDLAADYEEPEQVKSYYRGRKDLMQSLGAVVLEDTVVETLVAEATVTETAMSLEQLLSPPPPDTARVA